MFRTALAATLAIGAAAPALAPALAQVCTPGWNVVPSPNTSRTGDNVLTKIGGRSPSDIWAVGQVAPDSDPNVTQSFAVHYDGTAWSVIPTPNVGTQANALMD